MSDYDNFVARMGSFEDDGDDLFGDLKILEHSNTQSIKLSDLNGPSDRVLNYVDEISSKIVKIP